MAQVALMAASIAFSAMETAAQNRAFERRQDALNRQTQKEIEELERQQERESEIAAEKKSDRARELDIALGTIIAAGADGGQTAAGIARLGGAAAAVAGLDIGRIESNLQEAGRRRRAGSVSLIEENLAQQEQTNLAIKSNTMQFFGNAVGTVASSEAFSSVDTPTNTRSAPPRIFDGEQFSGSTLRR